MGKEQVVPLVRYDENGKRHIIGTAKLIPNREGLGVSARVTDKAFAKKLGGDISHLSIGNGEAVTINE